MCRSGPAGGASTHDLHHEGEGQLREAGVREAGRVEAVSHEGRRCSPLCPRCWYTFISYNLHLPYIFIFTYHILKEKVRNVNCCKVARLHVHHAKLKCRTLISQCNVD